MFKKLMFLISFVLVLGLVSSASAIDWTGGSYPDRDWHEGGNWLGGVVPGPFDEAIINSPPIGGPVIKANVTVSTIGGLRLNSNSTQTMHILSGDVKIGWWWDLSGGGTGTTILNMIGNANIEVGGIEGGYDGTTFIIIGGTTTIDSAVEWHICNEDAATVYLNIFDNAYIHVGPEKNAWRFADKGTMVTTISCNPTIIIDGKWRNGDEDGFSEINMSGGSLYVDRYLSVYDDGSAIINFSGGSINVNGLSYRGSGGGPYELNVSGSADITVREMMRLGYDMSPGASVTFNQSGGTIDCQGPFESYGAKGSVNINLTGGQISCTAFNTIADARPYSLDITEGTLIIDGDAMPQILTDIGLGHITAYGGASTVQYDYNFRNSGKTTVTALDTDYDGVSNYLEGNGDGNGDGIPDISQPNVASLPNIVDGQYVTLVSPTGTTLAGVSAIGNPSPCDTPGSVNFPFGFFEFTVSGMVPGGSTTVTLILPGPVMEYYKYGPGGWYEFDYDIATGTGAVISGNQVVLTIKDGGRGDDDMLANGKVVEPGGPAGPLCFVEFEDYTRFAQYWLQIGDDLPADLYKDETNTVNGKDLGEFVYWWLYDCPYGWPLR